ncbi:hypothetical protein BH09BAC2_BH09BAC2_23870 [soil metagenome]
MKKILFLLMLGFTISSASFAQDEKAKVKKTSTPTQKVHNVLSHHNKYNGTKSKHKKHGKKVMHKHSPRKTVTTVDK